VDSEPPDLSVGERGKQERDRQADAGDGGREDEARRDAAEIRRIGEEPLKVAEADEDQPVTERRGPVERQPQRVEGRPEEEGDGDGQLRSDECIREPAIAEDRAFHPREPPPTCRARRTPSGSRWTSPPRRRGPAWASWRR